jgi:hypothetical protein
VGSSGPAFFLLKADEYRRYLQNPELLRAEIAAQKAIRQVVIDEVEKVPPLLDEAHWLHENRGIRFALCGSSARKVKRGQPICWGDAPCVTNCTD